MPWAAQGSGTALGTGLSEQALSVLPQAPGQAELAELVLPVGQEAAAAQTVRRLLPRTAQAAAAGCGPCEPPLPRVLAAAAAQN